MMRKPVVMLTIVWGARIRAGVMALEYRRMLLLLLVFLIRRFGNLDNYLAAIELLFVEELDSFLCGLLCGQRNETIACRASTSEDDLR